MAVTRLVGYLYRKALSGEVFLAGVSEHLDRGDLEAARAACEAARGAPLAEVVLAGIESLPEGPEAVDAALDEAVFDWRPDVEQDTRGLVVLARVSALTGLLAGAVAVGRAFRHAESSGGSLLAAANTGLGAALLALCIGICAMFFALLVRGIVRRSGGTIRTDLERAVSMVGRAAGSSGSEEDRSRRKRPAFTAG